MRQAEADLTPEIADGLLGDTVVIIHFELVEPMKYK